MPCVTASTDNIQKLAAAIEADPALDITIDIENNQVTYGEGNSIEVTIPHTASDALMNGRWDPIAELLEGADKVSSTVTAAGYQ